MVRNPILTAIIIVLSSFSCMAQEKFSVQKTEKVNDTLFVIDHGMKYVVDKSVIIVKPKNDVYRLDKQYKNVYTSKSGCHYLEVPAGMDIEKFSESLKQTNQCEKVEYVTECRFLLEPNDPHKTHQWYINKINLKSAWNITTGNSNVKVAIIDTGVDRDYEDLGSTSSSNYTNISYSLGYDYIAGTQYSTPTDSHGSCVANIVGAKTNNGLYGCGITGGNNGSGVTLISYRVKNTLHVVQAINAAVNNGAKVINLSFSIPHDSDIDDAISSAHNHNVSIVCATGNESSSSICYPSSNSLTIAVGSSNQQDYRSTFSNYGTGIDLVGPGENIYVKGTSSNEYISAGGTSLSAPMVTGTIALMLSVNPNLTPNEIRTILHNSATKNTNYTYNSGWNSEVGYGILNTYLAVLYARLDIDGQKYINDEETYEIENLPSGYTVEWFLSDSYYNQNCLDQNTPSTNQCTITCSSSNIMMNATLTANVKYSGVTVRTLTKTVCAYDRFRGHYTSGNISADIDYSYILHVKPNYNTIITSPILLGASVSYSSSGLTPLYWGFSPSSGEIDVTMPTNNNGSPIVLNIDDVCDNHYTLYLFPTSNSSINVSTGDNSINIALVENLEFSKGIDQSWMVEIRNATTGELMATRSSSNRSESISTAGWPKGIYVVKVTIGKEEQTEKVIVG